MSSNQKTNRNQMMDEPQFRSHHTPNEQSENEEVQADTLSTHVERCFLSSIFVILSTYMFRNNCCIVCKVGLWSGVVTQKPFSVHTLTHSRGFVYSVGYLELVRREQ